MTRPDLAIRALRESQRLRRANPRCCAYSLAVLRVVENLSKFVIQILFLAGPFALQIVHANALLLSELPRLLHDARIGAQHDALQAIAHQAEIFHCHFANQDDWCTPEVVNDFEKKMASGGNKPEVFRYDAQHAFANEKSPAYDAPSAKASWDRMMAFLGKHL